MKQSPPPMTEAQREYYTELGRIGGKRSGETRKKKAMEKAKRVVKWLEKQKVLDNEPPFKYGGTNEERTGTESTLTTD